jgi:hypothetical protein
MRWQLARGEGDDHDDGTWWRSAPVRVCGDCASAADRPRHPRVPARGSGRHFDAELADTELDALPEMLSRWVRLATDGFEEFLLSKPFEGLEFGARSYDDDQAGDR